MELLEAIKNRRSIRRFLDVPVARDVLESVFEAAMEAPSPKNAQPWNFVVFEGEMRDTLIAKISAMVYEELELGLINDGVIATVKVLKQAPIVVFVYNRATSRYQKEADPITARVIDVQSIGASIQNLLLAAHEKGLGTLWICDLLDINPVVEMLVSDQELVAALAIGYPGIEPSRPPRRSIHESVSWMSDAN